MTNKLFFCSSFILVLLIANQQHAVALESLSAQELASHCILYDEDPDNKDAIFCVRYIQGFIDGAIATDERVMTNVAAEYEREESFSERAIRTRVKSRLNSHSPTYYAEFCLGEPVQLKDVVEKVVKTLSSMDNINQYTLGRDVVYQTLRDEYMCSDEQ